MKLFSLIKKISLFFYRYIRSDPQYFFQYCVTFFISNYKNAAVFLDDNDVLLKIRQGKTLIRIGDGEIGLLHGGSITYQEYDKNLSDGIKNIIKSYGTEDSFVLAIPRFVNFSNRELKSTKGGVRCWLPLKIEFRRIFSKTKSYADAHLFYRKENVDFLSDYLSARRLFVVTTKKNIQNLKNLELFQKESLFFVAEEPNPFSGYKRLFDELTQVLDADKDISKVTILLSAGPLSKMIAYDFSRRGVQAIDIGLGIESLHSKTEHEKNI